LATAGAGPVCQPQTPWERFCCCHQPEKAVNSSEVNQDQEAAVLAHTPFVRRVASPNPKIWFDFLINSSYAIYLLDPTPA